MATRDWNPQELRMTTDYLIDYHPEATHMTRVRVGALPPQLPPPIQDEFSQRMYMVALHWADGLALYDDKSVLLEVKVKLHSTALGQILTNMALFPETQEFQDRTSLPLEGEVVYAYPDKETLRMLEHQGIKTVQYRPDYIVQYYLDKLRKVYGPRPSTTAPTWRRVIGESE